MWDQLANIPPILVGQGILSCLDLKSIVRLETAVASKDQIRILRSFLSYFTEVDVKVNIPHDICKLKWYQTHDFQITKAIVNLDKLNATFDTTMINEIELIDNCIISRKTLNFLSDNCYEKISCMHFHNTQKPDVIEELFSRLVNLRELTVHCLPDGWIKGALKRLYEESNNNVSIEKIDMFVEGSESESSVVDIARYCPRLKSLCTWCNITEDSLLALSTHCPLLKKLDITNIPRMSTAQSAASCAPALSCIQSISTPRYDNTAVVFAIPYLTALQSVYVDGPIDHILLPLFFQYCLQLKEITIMASSSTTPAQLLQLVHNYPHLHKIRICNPFFNTDEIVIGLAQRCTNLQKLALDNEFAFDTVADNSILALSEHCPNLRELQFQYCTQITETAILHLVQQCKQLYFLAIPATVLSEDTVFGVPVKRKTKLNSFIMYTFDR